MLNENSAYIGNELHLFEKAHNWKNYYASFLKPFLKGDVLEVGAGIGGTTLILCNNSQTSWTCLEPDESLVTEIVELIAANKLPKNCKSVNGTLKNIDPSTKFDAIIYIDVIEHIEDDKTEVALAVEYLKTGGHLMILVPAHQYLYNEFDKALGHYRRYNKSMLKAVIPNGVEQIKLIYLDSLGLLASLANKLLLKQSNPTLKQILFWDNIIVRISKIIDPLIGNSLGKTVVGIWKKL